MPTRPRLGCIADDVTGATDLASNLVHGGMRVTQWFGVPAWEETADRPNDMPLSPLREDDDAVVIALKSRSIPADQAVTMSLSALRQLQAIGCERFFFKYCSTFDSGPQGNIGPVAEALMDALDAKLTVFCPAFPCNGRTVYQGHLFVGHRLLSESGMENHPVNPMRDACVVRLLQTQATRPVGLVAYDTIQQGPAAIAQRLSELLAGGNTLIVCDSCDDAQLATLAEGIAHLPLLTGGSGIARYLPQAYSRLAGQAAKLDQAYPAAPPRRGASMILAGSCSVATRRQIEAMRSQCHPLALAVPALMEGRDRYLSELLASATECLTNDPSRPLMIYSSVDPDEVRGYQTRFGGPEVSAAVESALAALARRVLDRCDIGQLIVAGGETSGAVAAALGIVALRIGPDICPGVPWSEARLADAAQGEHSRLSVAFKSGNFGDEQFFQTALGMLR